MNGTQLINSCLSNPNIHSGMDTINIFGNKLEVGGILDNIAMNKVFKNNLIIPKPKLTDFEAAMQIIKKSL